MRARTKGSGVASLTRNRSVQRQPANSRCFWLTFGIYQDLSSWLQHLLVFTAISYAKSAWQCVPNSSCISEGTSVADRSVTFFIHIQDTIHKFRAHRKQSAVVSTIRKTFEERLNATTRPAANGKKLTPQEERLQKARMQEMVEVGRYLQARRIHMVSRSPFAVMSFYSH